MYAIAGAEVIADSGWWGTAALVAASPTTARVVVVVPVATDAVPLLNDDLPLARLLMCARGAQEGEEQLPRHGADVVVRDLGDRLAEGASS